MRGKDEISGGRAVQAAQVLAAALAAIVIAIASQGWPSSDAAADDGALPKAGGLLGVAERSVSVPVSDRRAV